MKRGDSDDEFDADEAVSRLLGDKSSKGKSPGVSSKPSAISTSTAASRPSSNAVPTAMPGGLRSLFGEVPSNEGVPSGQTSRQPLSPGSDWDAEGDDIPSLDEQIDSPLKSPGALKQPPRLQQPLGASPNAARLLTPILSFSSITGDAGQDAEISASSTMKRQHSRPSMFDADSPSALERDSSREQGSEGADSNGVRSFSPELLSDDEFFSPASTTKNNSSSRASGSIAKTQETSSSSSVAPAAPVVIEPPSRPAAPAETTNPPASSGAAASSSGSEGRVEVVPAVVSIPSNLPVRERLRLRQEAMKQSRAASGSDS
jgi:hypothetical protein